MPAETMTVEENPYGSVQRTCLRCRYSGHSIPADEKVKRCLRRVVRAGLWRQGQQGIKVGAILLAGTLSLTGLEREPQALQLTELNSTQL